MATVSYARSLLEQWGVAVEDIPTSERKEADFLATFDGVRVLIEEKTKEEDPARAAARESKHGEGLVHAETLPSIRDETVSGVIRDASKQLKSSSLLPHEFRLLWFTATGPTAQGKYEQFIATVYGRTSILEMNVEGYRRCYFFRHGDFYRRAAVLDGAVAAYTDGKSMTVRLCLNPLSENFERLRRSPVLRVFGTGVEDPIELEARGTAFILDTSLDRGSEGPLLAYLQQKYKTGPLMKIDLGYTRMSVAIDGDEP